MLFLAGSAIDVAHVMAARTPLQVAADASAHAALLTRETRPEAEARTRAIEIAERNMPPEIFGTVLPVAQVEFGRWDERTRQFVPQQGSREAVRVRTRRNDDGENPVATFLLHLVGLDSWQVERESILQAYVPSCFREGFVAEWVVDIQSNNTFRDGFCIHSNTHVALNINNFFEPGTIVSMPNPDDIKLPDPGFRTNTGLREALREGTYNIRILNRIETIIAGLLAFDRTFLPNYIANTVPLTLPSSTVQPSHLQPGRLHRFTCNGNGRLTTRGDVAMSRVVLVTNCKIRFQQGARVEDSIVVSTNTEQKSINSASGLQIGRNVNCATGGGAQFITLGGMDFPSGLQLYVSQLVAKRNISFAAQANGIQGASMVAGGRIDGTSNMAMGFCGRGMESSFQANYTRLVQ